MGMGILKRENLWKFCTEASLGDARQHQDFTELHGESDDPGGILGAENPINVEDMDRHMDTINSIFSITYRD